MQCLIGCIEARVVGTGIQSAIDWCHRTDLFRRICVDGSVRIGECSRGRVDEKTRGEPIHCLGWR